MLTIPLLVNARANAQRLEAINRVLERVGLGVFKRIDENRELVELLQDRCPGFLEQHPWVLGWLRSQDDFLTELAKAAAVPEPRQRAIDFPRPWPPEPKKAGGS